MSGIPAGIAQAFATAAGELGFASAAWMFVREVGAEGGEPLVAGLRDALGRTFPVLDAIAAAWLAGERAQVDVDAAVGALGDVTRLLVVGVEADPLDALVPRLPAVDIALLAESGIAPDWDRVLANYGGRVRRADLSDLHTLAGARSAVLTFVYGHDGHAALVHPAFLRVLGPDVVTQFRGIVGWNVLPRPLYVYPRYLYEQPLAAFTAVIG